MCCRYLQPFGHMRWHFPFVLDLMKLGNQAFDNLPPLLQLDHSTGWGQDFKGYTDVSSGKYAPKWLVHRLLQLVEAQSLEQYRTNLLASEPYSSCAGRDCLNVALSRMQRYQYQDILFPTPVRRNRHHPQLLVCVLCSSILVCHCSSFFCLQVRGGASMKLHLIVRFSRDQSINLVSLHISAHQGPAHCVQKQLW